MSLRHRSFNFFLWWAVIGFSIWVGGTIFSMSVVVPMWSENPPQSVKDFFGQTSFNKTIYNFFGPPWMAARNLPLFIALALGWSNKFHRVNLSIAAGAVALGIVYTLLYVYSINAVLMTAAVDRLSTKEILTMVDDWIFADRLRFGVMFIGYLFLLRSFNGNGNNRLSTEMQ